MTDAPRGLPEQNHAADDGGVLSGASDLLHAAAYSAVQKPLDGITQIVRHVTDLKVSSPDLLSAPTHENMWTSTGSIAGSVVDYFILAKGVGGLRSNVFNRAASVPILEAGTTGALFELAQPVNDNDFASNKFKSAALGFGTFATIDGAAHGLGRLNLIKEAPAFVKAIGVNGISGGAGGFTHSILSAELNGRTPTYGDIRSDVASYAAFGAMFGALDFGATTAKTSMTIKINERISHGEPIFSVGPIEVHPRNFHKTARENGQIDALTGLKNKSGGNEVLSTEVNRSERSGEPLSMTYMDLDGFKAVNDRFGHNHGDLVLKEVSDYMRRFYQRSTDVPIREGGDEFMMVMPNTPLVHADSLAAGFERTMRIAVGKGAPSMEQLSYNYPGRIAKLQEIPRTVEGGAGQDIADLAEQLISTRMALTGETLTPNTVSAEIARLKAKTGFTETQNLGGKTIEVYGDADIARLAHTASFEYLPQLGQVLKVKGYATEPQIQEAFKAQSEYPKERKPLIGQILVEKGYAKPEHIEDALREQMIAKEALSRILESTPGISLASAGIKPFRMPEIKLVPSNLNAYREPIPDVWRPPLNANGIRQLGAFGSPASGEVVVGASTGVVEYKSGESLADFKHRGDKLMFDKKAERKALGLRRDRELHQAHESIGTTFGTN